MTEKHDYTATVRGKGLDHTGVTEDLAKTMYATLGRHTIAIVDLKHVRQVNDDNTGRKVELSIDALEPCTDEQLENHLRQIMRTLHQNRTLKADDGQLVIDTTDDLEPTVEGVIAAGQAHVAETDDQLPDPDDDPADPDDDGPDADQDRDDPDDPDAPDAKERGGLSVAFSR